MLTEKQAKFVREYLIDLNGTKAAIRAGFAESGASTEAYRLLRNAQIRGAIDHAMEARGERTQITADQVVSELAKIAFANIKSVTSWTQRGIVFIPSEDISDEDSPAIAEVSERTSESEKSSSTTIKVKMHDKLRALQLLALHLGMLKGIDEETAAYRAMPLDQLIQLAAQKIPEIKAINEPKPTISNKPRKRKAVHSNK